jgi:thioredoxin 1
MAKVIKEDEFNKLIVSGKPVVCDFFATWCGPCKMLAPVIEEVEEGMADKAVFVKVDIDESFPLAARYGIMSVPYVAIFKAGELVDKFIGYSSKEEVEEFVTKNF